MPASKPPLQDTESFSNLYSRTHLIIFRFIYGIHGGPVEEVEDITSDTYMRAWKSRNRFFGEDHDALCWLFTIARHLVIDAHRKNRSHRQNMTQRLDEANLDIICSSDQPLPEEKVAWREQYIHLWNVLQNMPSDRREMLVLRFMVGWQVKQIASFLDMEENTVSVYIRRSLDHIRQNWIEI